MVLKVVLRSMSLSSMAKKFSNTRWVFNGSFQRIISILKIVLSQKLNFSVDFLHFLETPDQKANNAVTLFEIYH